MAYANYLHSGFTFVKELTLDVQNVIAPPKEKSQVEAASKVESPKSPTALTHAEDAKSDKPPGMQEDAAVENRVHNDKSDTGGSPRSATGTPRAITSSGSPTEEDLLDSGFGKTTSAETSVSFDKENPR